MEGKVKSDKMYAKKLKQKINLYKLYSVISKYISRLGF